MKTSTIQFGSFAVARYASQSHAALKVRMVIKQTFALCSVRQKFHLNDRLKFKDPKRKFPSPLGDWDESGFICLGTPEYNAEWSLQRLVQVGLEAVRSRKKLAGTVPS